MFAELGALLLALSIHMPSSVLAQARTWDPIYACNTLPQAVRYAKALRTAVYGRKRDKANPKCGVLSAHEVGWVVVLGHFDARVRLFSLALAELSQILMSI